MITLNIHDVKSLTIRPSTHIDSPEGGFFSTHLRIVTSTSQEEIVLFSDNPLEISHTLEAAQP